ncbi:MAG: hypothetical protein FWH17_04465 [Oscillospiraceae bacterium]|nr:hypothetical protein [Oscillospiraceae bacterium]
MAGYIFPAGLLKVFRKNQAGAAKLDTALPGKSYAFGLALPDLLLSISALYEIVCKHIFETKVYVRCCDPSRGEFSKGNIVYSLLESS